MDRRQTILTMPGVYTLVSFGAEPAEIPGPVLQTIRRAVDSSLRIEPKPYVRSEQSSKRQSVVRKGPLAGATGIVESTGTTYDLIVAIDLIAKSVAIRVDPAWLCLELDRDRKSVV